MKLKISARSLSAVPPGLMDSITLCCDRSICWSVSFMVVLEEARRQECTGAWRRTRVSSGYSRMGRDCEHGDYRRDRRRIRKPPTHTTPNNARIAAMRPLNTSAADIQPLRHRILLDALDMPGGDFEIFATQDAG